MPAKIADQVASAMEQVVSEGTGRAAQQTFPVYGKTGTTDDFTNAWFTGCTHTLCITVWMGYDRPYVKSGGKIVAHELKSTGGAPVYGGTIPAEIFAKMYSNLRFLQSPTKYPMPSATPTAPYVPQKTASATPTATASAKSTKKPGKGSTSSPKPTKQPTKAPSKKPTTPASTGPTKKASTAPTAG
jgi:penicillin-binding protein 1A